MKPETMANERKGEDSYKPSDYDGSSWNIRHKHEDF